MVTAINANETAINNINTFPAGGIVMWSGSVASIPTGWNLCDGTNSTPDLRNRFVVGAGDTYSPDDTGGADAVTLTTAQMPAHGHSGSTNTAGNHRHLEYHYHYNGSGDGGGPGASCCEGAIEHSGVYTGYAGNHSHTVSINNTGGGGSHENRPPYYALAYIMKA
jgi:microcystin-dependent protein